MTVTTRFAPSPTGRLHVGNIRTALHNFLFARKNDGVFLLRIDDTDRERSTQASDRAICDDLGWLGIARTGLFGNRSASVFMSASSSDSRMRDEFTPVLKRPRSSSFDAKSCWAEVFRLFMSATPKAKGRRKDGFPIGASASTMVRRCTGTTLSGVNRNSTPGF